MLPRCHPVVTLLDQVRPIVLNLARVDAQQGALPT